MAHSNEIHSPSVSLFILSISLLSAFSLKSLWVNQKLGVRFRMIYRKHLITWRDTQISTSTFKGMAWILATHLFRTKHIYLKSSETKQIKTPSFKSPQKGKCIKEKLIFRSTCSLETFADLEDTHTTRV